MRRDPPAGPKLYGAAKARGSSGKHDPSLWLDPRVKHEGDRE